MKLLLHARYNSEHVTQFIRFGYLGLTGTMDSDGAEWDSEGPQQTVGVTVPGGFVSGVGLPVSLSSVFDDTILLLVSPTAS